MTDTYQPGHEPEDDYEDDELEVGGDCAISDDKEEEADAPADEAG